MNQFRRGLDGEERGVGLEVIVVELPDKTGLRGIAHPGDDGGARLEQFGVAAFVHGAKGLVIGQLRLAREVRQVGHLAVTRVEEARVLVAVLRAARQVMLGPVVVNGFPILLRHHAVNGFQRGYGHAADFGLENILRAKTVEFARRPPAIRAARMHPAPGGGTGLIKPRRLQFRHQGPQGVVNLLGRVPLVARAPDGDGGMVAKAQDFLAHVGQIRVQVGWIGAVAGVGLEKLVPDQNAGRKNPRSCFGRPNCG